MFGEEVLQGKEKGGGFTGGGQDRGKGVEGKLLPVGREVYCFRGWEKSPTKKLGKNGVWKKTHVDAKETDGKQGI